MDTSWGVVVANFATTTVDGELEQESNLQILKKCSSGRQKSYANKKGHSVERPCIHDGGDEGDRTPDLLTASQALSQLSYAPVRRSTIRELPRRCKDNFGKYSAARGTGTRPKRHTMPEIARGACPAGGGEAAARLSGFTPVAPGIPATKPAHLLRLGEILRPWRLGQKQNRR